MLRFCVSLAVLLFSLGLGRAENLWLANTASTTSYYTADPSNSYSVTYVGSCSSGVSLQHILYAGGTLYAVKSDGSQVYTIATDGSTPCESAMLSDTGITDTVSNVGLYYDGTSVCMYGSTSSETITWTISITGSASNRQVWNYQTTTNHVVHPSIGYGTISGVSTSPFCVSGESNESLGDLGTSGGNKYVLTVSAYSPAGYRSIAASFRDSDGSLYWLRNGGTSLMKTSDLTGSSQVVSDLGGPGSTWGGLAWEN